MVISCEQIRLAEKILMSEQQGGVLSVKMLDFQAMLDLPSRLTSSAKALKSLALRLFRNNKRFAVIT